MIDEVQKRSTKTAVTSPTGEPIEFAYDSRDTYELIDEQIY